MNAVSSEMQVSRQAKTGNAKEKVLNTCIIIFDFWEFYNSSKKECYYNINVPISKFIYHVFAY